jgi:anthranilate phosphoribosyltransferase
MDTLSWPALIRALIKREALSADETAWAMNEIMEGAASPAQIAGFGVALRAKGETAEEMSGLAAAMLAHATPITIGGPVTDLVGTGADGAHTVNVSTMATIVAAAAGARMVKHGNRAASSACGAADVLEALGVVIDLPPAATEALFAELGVAFLFAPLYHPAFRHTGPVRRELGVPTAFNYLGPLTNPARPSSLAVGVADPRMGPVLAGVLAARGNSAIVFHGEGLDELTTTGPSSVWVVADGTVSPAEFDATSLGLPRASVADLRGGDAAHNAGVVRSVLSGEPGPVRDIVLLNAAAALAATDGLSFLPSTSAAPPAPAVSSAPSAASAPPASDASGTVSIPAAPDPSAIANALTKALTDGLARAAEAIDSGAAEALLTRWSETSRRLAIPNPRV